MIDGKEWGPGLNLRDKSKFGGKKCIKNTFHLILNLAVGGNYFGVWGPMIQGQIKKQKRTI